MNEWTIIIAMLVGGLVMLVAGGELLVRGASTVAATVGISPLVVGLTVVAFGTSAPELAVSLNAGFSGNPDIAAGNVIGSNIFNVLFILGLCALILPLVVSRQLVRREVPLMIGISVLLWALAFDGQVGAGEGIILVAGLIAYTGWSVIESRKETAAGGGAAPVDLQAGRGTGWLSAGLALLAIALIGSVLDWFDPAVSGLLGLGAVLFTGGIAFGAGGGQRPAHLARQVGLILAGLGTLVLGADYLIEAATSIARAFAVSDLIIGLTIVAAGTSLPEVATSIVATLRNERDIAIGNVVGSNIFNILGILGLSAVITPGGLVVNPQMVAFDIPIMIAVAVACLPVFFTQLSIARWEGAIFFGSYVAYTAFLVLAAARNPALETLTAGLMLILPLVVIVLGWTAFQALRARGRSGL